MLAYVFRKILYNIPIFLCIILFVMSALRVHDPAHVHLGKQANEKDIEAFREKAGLNRPFIVQYFTFLVTFDLTTESWVFKGHKVGELLGKAIIPSLAVTMPTLAMTATMAICIGLVSAFFRGQAVDRSLVIVAVLGMSVSYLVYIILGQYFGAYLLNSAFEDREIFAIEGYEPGLVNWQFFCLLPVLIGVVVGLGYDTRFYRAVLVEETNRDYIVTARAKGASQMKIMFVHILKNAMIPIITRVVITLPFLIMGSILLETFFNIPGMGGMLIAAVRSNDFPVVQAFTSVFAAAYILSVIFTDILYALVDPRVRLQ